MEDHLYEFNIKGRRYVNFGNDGDYFVDAKDTCVCCEIPLYLIGFSRGDAFDFIFDFGE